MIYESPPLRTQQRRIARSQWNHMSDRALLEPTEMEIIHSDRKIELHVREAFDPQSAARWNAFLATQLRSRVVHRAEWAAIFQEGLGHRPKYIEASQEGRIVGVMPLVFMKSFLFGRFLVSSPYVNVGGPIAIANHIEQALVTRAVELADELDVDRLELRNEKEIVHPALTAVRTDKTIMLRPLPTTPDELLKSYG